MATESEVNATLDTDAQADREASDSIARTAATATEQGNIQTNIKQQQAVKHPGSTGSFITDPQFWSDVGTNAEDLGRGVAHGALHGTARAMDWLAPHIGSEGGYTADVDSQELLKPTNPDRAPSEVGNMLGTGALGIGAAPETAVTGVASLGVAMAKQGAFWAAIGAATSDDRVKGAEYGAAGGAGGEVVGVAAKVALASAGSFMRALFEKGGTEVGERIASEAPHGLPTETTPWTPDTVDAADTAHPKAAGTQTPAAAPAQDGFMADFDKLPDHETEIGTKRVGNASVSVDKDPFDPNTVHLSTIRADETGQGYGQQAMQQMADLADKHGARMTLDAIPMDKDGISHEALSDFYQKYSFGATDGGLVEGRAMVRDAKPLEAPPPEVPSGPPVFDPKGFAGNLMEADGTVARAALVDAIKTGDLSKIGALQKFMPNLPWDQLREGGNLQATFHALADHYGGLVADAGGAKVIPKEMQLQFAANQGRDPQVVMDTLNNLGQHTDDGGLAARVLAGHHLDIETASQLQAAAQAVSDAVEGSAEHTAAANKFNEALEMKLAVQAVMSGAKNELGRSLGALRYMAENRALQIPADFADGKTATQIADALLKKAKGAGGGINLQGMNEAARAIKQIGPVDWLTEMMRNGLLSSPALHWVNAKANVVRFGVSVIEQYAAAAVGTVSQGIGTAVHAAADAAGIEMQPMAQQMSLRSANAWTLGAWNAATDGTVWKDAVAKVFRDAPVDYNGQPSRIAIKGNIQLSDLPKATQGITGIQNIADMANKVLDTAGKVIRAPGRALGVADHINVTIAQRASLTQQAYLRASSMADSLAAQGSTLDRAPYIAKQMKELLLDPTSDMLVKAQADGSYASMQEAAQLRPTFLGLGGDMDKPGIGAAVNNALNKNKLIKMMIAPFTTRPGNAFRQGIFDYTPLGAMFDKTTQSKLLGGGVDMNLAAARVLMGTSTMYAAWHLFESGHITGSSGPGDLSKLNEVPDYSLKVGDSYIPVKRMEPAGIWLGAMADAHAAINSRNTTYDASGNASDPMTRALMAFAMASGHMFLEMPAMSGLKRYMDVMATTGGKGLEQKGINLVGGMASEFVPFSGAGGYANMQMDGTRHIPENIWQAICQRIPGMEGGIPVDRDVFGRPVKALNQYATTTGAQDPLSQAVSKVQGNLKAQPQWLAPPSDGQQGVPLDAHLARELEQIKGEQKLPGLGGKTFPQYATDFIQGPHWQNAGQHGSKTSPDGGNYEHMDMLQSLLQKGNGAAWQQLYTNHPDLRGQQREAMKTQLAPVIPK